MVIVMTGSLSRRISAAALEAQYFSGLTGFYDNYRETGRPDWLSWTLPGVDENANCR
jgi:hypothetical protein